MDLLVAIVKHNFKNPLRSITPTSVDGRDPTDDERLRLTANDWRQRPTYFFATYLSTPFASGSRR